MAGRSWTTAWCCWVVAWATPARTATRISLCCLPGEGFVTSSIVVSPGPTPASNPLSALQRLVSKPMFHSTGSLSGLDGHEIEPAVGCPSGVGMDAGLVLSRAGGGSCPLLQDYCVRCHGKEEVKGDRDLESWMASSTFWEDSHTLREIWINSISEMPPDKVGVRQPAPELRRKVVRALTLRLGELTRVLFHPASDTSTDPKEYLHTLSDLLGIDAQAADLTGPFLPRSGSMVRSPPSGSAAL